MLAKFFVRFLIMILFCGEVFAFSNMTYQGRIVRPDGTPVESGSVTISIQIKSPGSESCLMFSETHILNMTGSKGVFSIDIGTGTRSSAAVDGGLPFSKIFSNKLGAIGPFPSCDVGMTYSPNMADNRKIIISFNDGSGTQTLSAQNLSFVPFSIETLQVGGYTSSQLLKTASGVNTSEMTGADYTNFLNLLAGTSTLYSKTNQLNGTALPSLGANESIRWNGSSWEAYVPVSLAFTPLNPANNLSDVASPSVSRTNLGLGSAATLNVGPLPGNVVMLDGSGKIPSLILPTYVAAVNTLTPLVKMGTATNPQIAIGSGTATGQVLRWDQGGTTWQVRNLEYSDLANSLATSPWPTVSCLANEYISWSSITDAFVCAPFPDATGAQKGLVQVGDGLSVTAGVLSLPDVVTAGSYPKVTVDKHGRVIGTAALTNAEMTTALGYTPLNKAGDTMSGALDMGTQDITNTGHISMAANKYLTLSSNATNGSAAGQIWFDAGTVKYFDGTIVRSLGVAGAGMQSLNGSSANNQSFATPGTTGTAPDWSTVAGTGVHTLNIPLASTAGVTAGLISKSEYDSFNTKLGTATSFTGDVSGTYNSTSVDKIKGTDVSATAPTTGQFLVYNGTTQYVPVSMSADATMAANGALTLNTVAVNKGGTGATTLPSGSLLIGNGTTAINSLAAGASGNVLYGTGANAWSTGTPDAAGLVDKTSAQTISGAKTFTSTMTVSPSAAATKGEVIRGAVGQSANLTEWQNSSSTVLSSVDALGNFQMPGLQITGGTPGANKVLTSDASGNASWQNPSASAISGIIPIANGGTNSSTALNNNRIMVSTGGQIREAAALTNGQLLIGSTGAAPVAAGITQGSGITVTNGAGTITIASTGMTALTGDVTATGPGSSAATVAQVGGMTAANVATGATAANNATSANTASRIVARDASGNFSAGTITATTFIGALTGSASGNVLKTGDTMTGALNLPSNGLAVGTTQLVVSGGNVGIGAAPAAEKLEVSGNVKATRMIANTATTTSATVEVGGQILSKVYNAAAATAINWNNGNLQYTTATCGAFTFSNMYDGGSYTLVVKSTTSGTCSFSQATPDVLAAGAFLFMPAIAATAPGKQTVFTFLRAGSNVYVTWLTGF